MNKTGNSSQYRELQDDELDAVSGGESWLGGFVKAIISIGLPTNDVINMVDALTSRAREPRRARTRQRRACHRDGTTRTITTTGTGVRHQRRGH